MSGFWAALENATQTETHFRSDRQTSLQQAEDKARSFFDEMSAEAQRLLEKGVRVTRTDRTVSFRRGSSEVLAVIFGTHDGTEVTVVSPVIEYLKLSPSYEELHFDDDISEAAGRWLGRSIEVVERNRSTFAPLGLA